VTLFESWKSAGSLLHTVGAAILKARAPHAVRDLGKCNTSLDNERSVTVYNALTQKIVQIVRCR